MSWNWASLSTKIYTSEYTSLVNIFPLIQKEYLLGKTINILKAKFKTQNQQKFSNNSTSVKNNAS
jgi:hypothetical protein